MKKQTIINLIILWLVLATIVTIIIFNVKDNNNNLEQQAEINKRIQFCSDKLDVSYYRVKCNEYGECHKQYIDCKLKMYKTEEVEAPYGFPNQ